MDRLVQNKIYKKQVLYLTEDKVTVEETRFLIKNKYSIKYIDIHDEPMEQKKSSKIALGIFIFFTIASIGTFITKDLPNTTTAPTAYFYHACAAMIALFYFLITMENKFIFYSSPFHLIIYKNIPDKVKVGEFINTLLQKRRDYIVSNYLIHDESFVSKSDEIKKLEWLKNNKIISENEFEKLKNEVVGNSNDNFVSYN